MAFLYVAQSTSMADAGSRRADPKSRPIPCHAAGAKLHIVSNELAHEHAQHRET